MQNGLDIHAGQPCLVVKEPAALQRHAGLELATIVESAGQIGFLLGGVRLHYSLYGLVMERPRWCAEHKNYDFLMYLSDAGPLDVGLGVLQQRQRLCRSA